MKSPEIDFKCFSGKVHHSLKALNRLPQPCTELVVCTLWLHSRYLQESEALRVQTPKVQNVQSVQKRRFCTENRCQRVQSVDRCALNAFSGFNAVFFYGKVLISAKICSENGFVRVMFPLWGPPTPRKTMETPPTRKKLGGENIGERRAVFSAEPDPSVCGCGVKVTQLCGSMRCGSASCQTTSLKHGHLAEVTHDDLTNTSA